jgi:hypothetical protein
LNDEPDLDAVVRAVMTPLCEWRWTTLGDPHEHVCIVGNTHRSMHVCACGEVTGT